MSTNPVRLDHVTQRYGPITAVDDLSFEIRPGAVTGFLGPNGAGKTTTLRMLLGLAEPTAGSATIFGRRYVELEDPLGTVARSWRPPPSIRGARRVTTCA
jgi:ABC-2 type transport system ATP-binding protein